MQSSLTVITPAKSLSLVSLYEAKLALNLQGSTDPVLDEQLEMMIEWGSAQIAALCNRTFARETVIETFDSVGDHNRLFLSRYPITNISVVTEDGETLVVDDDFAFEAETGMMRRVDSPWYAPLSISYTGGYDLPNESPKALRHAALLMTREAYFAMSRGDASIKTVRHKESSVTYFDPNQQSRGGGPGGGGSAATRAVGDLLKHFTRFYV